MRLLSKAIVLLVLLVLSLSGCMAPPQTKSLGPWVPDNGDATYQNPIIFADYSDPDVIRHGDDFYMTASSFNCVPGLPILHSKDLVNWKIIGHAIQHFDDERFDIPQHGNGVWAPSLRYHDNWFWIFFGDPDAGIFMTKAKNPAGPWEPLYLVQQGKGLIDPCPLWDDDGKAYLVHAWANSRAGIKSILTVRQMSPDGTKFLDDGTMVFDGRNGVQPTIEGPKFYKRRGYYYILAPAGGVRQGWQLALRSKSVFGPYEVKRVMEQGSTDINGPHQGGWIELKKGQSWFVHFQDRQAYGRVVHLNPVQWVDGWPLMGVDLDGNDVGEPVARYKKPNVSKQYSITTPQTSDEFSSATLGLQWQFHADYMEKWFSLRARSGWLRLFSVPKPDDSANIWLVPNLLLQKLPAPEFALTTKIGFGNLAQGEMAGLIIMGMDYSYLAVEKTSQGFQLVKRYCKKANEQAAEILESTVDIQGDTLFLRVDIDDSVLCDFSYSLDNKEFTEIGRTFTARQGRWIGAKIGLFCLAKNDQQKPGYADFDFFRFKK